MCQFSHGNTCPKPSSFGIWMDGFWKLVKYRKPHANHRTYRGTFCDSSRGSVSLIQWNLNLYQIDSEILGLCRNKFALKSHSQDVNQSCVRWHFSISILLKWIEHIKFSFLYKISLIDLRIPMKLWITCILSQGRTRFWLCHSGRARRRSSLLFCLYSSYTMKHCDSKKCSEHQYSCVWLLQVAYDIQAVIKAQRKD